MAVDAESLWFEPEPSGLGRPPAHSRAEIVAAAVAVADAEGLGAVTMRRVAARIGAGAMSVYNYVPDKETLLELMIDQVTGEYEPPATPSGDWRADLRRLAHEQRVVMRRHPWLPTALPSRQALGPSALACMEYAVAVMEPIGLDGPEMFEVFALLTGFVASHVTYELAHERASERTARPAGELADAQARYLRTAAGRGRYPRLAEIAAAPRPGGAARSTFDRLLDRMINAVVVGRVTSALDVEPPQTA